ncbi:hypothetical protein QE152_g26735 [Popillia japonica]|uniref:Uncharacterized protein n=1 Tax=Popillia japonica TaxID=7064 RepID=A0AAW1JWZ2_POPJA
MQIKAEDIAQVADNIGRGGFEQIESDDIQRLLESQDEDLTEIDLKEMLKLHPIEDEETSTSTEKTTLNVKTLREALNMANELCDFFINSDLERSLTFKRQILNAIV